MNIKTYVDKENVRIVAEVSSDFYIADKSFYKIQGYIKSYLDNEREYIEKNYIDKEDALTVEERSKLNEIVRYFISSEDEADILQRIADSLSSNEILEMIEEEYVYVHNETEGEQREVIDKAIMRWMADKFNIDYELIEWVTD